MVTLNTYWGLETSCQCIPFSFSLASSFLLYLTLSFSLSFSLFQSLSVFSLTHTLTHSLSLSVHSSLFEMLKTPFEDSLLNENRSSERISIDLSSWRKSGTVGRKFQSEFWVVGSNLSTEISLDLNLTCIVLHNTVRIKFTFTDLLLQAKLTKCCLDIIDSWLVSDLPHNICGQIIFQKLWRF